MNRSTTLAARLTRMWAALYTAGLADGRKRARCDELESDLWEQELSGVSNGAALARLVLGMPADLSWRLEQRASAELARGVLSKGGTMLTLVKERWPFGLVAFFVVAMLFYGGMILIYGGEDIGTVKRVYFGLGPIVASALIVAGFAVSGRLPWQGAALLTIGAAALPAIHPWFFPVYAPFSIVIIAFGIVRARGIANERDRPVPA